MKTSIESSLTLESVAERFAQWRKNKSKGERIPEQLWCEAISLLSTYRISEVTRTLRLSGADLNKRRQRTEARPSRESLLVESSSEDSRNKRYFSTIPKVSKTRRVSNSPDHQPEIASFRALVGVASEPF